MLPALRAGGLAGLAGVADCRFTWMEEKGGMNQETRHVKQERLPVHRNAKCLLSWRTPCEKRPGWHESHEIACCSRRGSWFRPAELLVSHDAAVPDALGSGRLLAAVANSSAVVVMIVGTQVGDDVAVVPADADASSRKASSRVAVHNSRRQGEGVAGVRWLQLSAWRFSVVVCHLFFRPPPPGTGSCALRAREWFRHRPRG